MKKIKHGNLYFIVNALTKGGAERQVLTLQRELGGTIILLENIIQYDDVNMDNLTVLIPNPSKSFFGKLFQYFIGLYRLFIILRADRSVSKPVAISFLERSNVSNLIVSFFAKHTCILSIRINLDIQYKSAPVFRLFAKMFYRYAHKVTTNSEGMRQLLVDQYNVQDSKAMYMPNAYNVPFIKSKSKESLANLELDRLASHSRFMLSVNRLDDQKLVTAQLLLYKELKDEYPDLKLLIVGDGPARDQLISFSTSQGLCTYSIWNMDQPSIPTDSEVYFLGLVSNPYRLYHLTVCLLLTSKYESLPNVIIEGLICNSTIISGDCRFGPREILAGDINYETDYGSSYGIKRYGILLPVPHDVSTRRIWIEYLSLILTGKIDLSFKQAIPERIAEYEVDLCITRWKNLVE